MTGIRVLSLGALVWIIDVDRFTSRKPAPRARLGKLRADDRHSFHGSAGWSWGRANTLIPHPLVLGATLLIGRLGAARGEAARKNIGLKPLGVRGQSATSFFSPQRAGTLSDCSFHSPLLADERCCVG